MPDCAVKELAGLPSLLLLALQAVRAHRVGRVIGSIGISERVACVDAHI